MNNYPADAAHFQPVSLPRVARWSKSLQKCIITLGRASQQSSNEDPSADNTQIHDDFRDNERHTLILIPHCIAIGQFGRQYRGKN